MVHRKKVLETKEVTLSIDPWGRIYIPATLLKALGLQFGAVMFGRMEKDRLVLSKRDPMKELRAMFKNAKFSTKDFISERRKEARSI